MQELSESLLPIYKYELSKGNEVLRVEENAWSECPLAVVFKYPLHFEEIARYLKLPEIVEQWENRDTHYELEKGFVCQHTKHSLAGPLEQELRNKEHDY